MTPDLSFVSSEFIGVKMTFVTCIFTIDMTCCSLHIAPGLKGHDFKAFSCSTDSFFMSIRL